MKIKTILNASLPGFGLTSTAIAGSAETKANTIHQATYIQFTANTGQESKLAGFLKAGAQLVHQTEPQTKLWFALQGDKETFAIFDVFHDEAGRVAHFSGKVAAALQDNSVALVKGGWLNGVLNAVQNSEILATNNYQSDDVLQSTKASYIILKAKSGKEQELAALLQDGAAIISKTEPKTLFWLALKLDESTYAIFDTFTDDTGVQAHFSGAVAGALKSQAENLIVGGWQHGVLDNVHQFNVIAAVK
ncbi:putative quinol monooxygenase [Legionella fallonii]|uniref:Antibiotic biosynthesis monooxygenase n=1 Tax=Legionella fallonii LLAP-10 TaxID=1212491 RepID=A0A098G6V1_9GAMM|nr:hypothetical protein [Legionella fallonii]CEG57721.1 conserved exported protein of unknown function [Legionella fallonii LLAP-10]